jgi:hypothetical protein
VPQGLDNLTILFTLWNKAKPSAKRIPQGKFDYSREAEKFFENTGFFQSVNLSVTMAKAAMRAGMEKAASARRKE